MLSQQMTERSARPHCYRYKMVSLAADIACFTVHPIDGLQIALVRRSWNSQAFPGYWALPGGFLQADVDTSIEQCAKRELFEEMHVQATHLELVQVYSAVGRDPRPERIVSVAFLAVIPAHDLDLTPAAETDVVAAQWFPFDQVEFLDLAFDHRQIIRDARNRLASKISFGSRNEEQPDILFSFLPAKFTISKAERITAALQGAHPDRGNFRKWIERFADPTDELEPGRTRSSRLYARKTEPNDAANSDPLVAPPPLREVEKLAERFNFENFDYFLSTMQNSTSKAVALLESIIKDYASNTRFSIKSTGVPDLRIYDQRTGRVLITLRWQNRKQSFACTALADPYSLRALGLEDLRRWSGSPHLSAFRLQGNPDDAKQLHAVLEMSGQTFPI